MRRDFADVESVMLRPLNSLGYELNTRVMKLSTLLLTWINFDPSMDKKAYAQESVARNYLSIPKLQRFQQWM